MLNCLYSALNSFSYLSLVIYQLPKYIHLSRRLCTQIADVSNSSCLIVEPLLGSPKCRVILFERFHIYKEARSPLNSLFVLLQYPWFVFQQQSICAHSPRVLCLLYATSAFWPISNSPSSAFHGVFARGKHCLAVILILHRLHSTRHGARWCWATWP